MSTIEMRPGTHTTETGGYFRTPPCPSPLDSPLAHARLCHCLHVHNLFSVSQILVLGCPFHCRRVAPPPSSRGTRSNGTCFHCFYSRLLLHIDIARSVTMCSMRPSKVQVPDGRSVFEVIVDVSQQLVDFMNPLSSDREIMFINAYLVWKRFKTIDVRIVTTLFFLTLPLLESTGKIAFLPDGLRPITTLTDEMFDNLLTLVDAQEARRLYGRHPGASWHLKGVHSRKMRRRRARRK